MNKDYREDEYIQEIVIGLILALILFAAVIFGLVIMVAFIRSL